ncbi:MAG: GTP 3',8-cyclase MoaA [Syntrophomonadaceae bacterium]|nr:GTP 3',8-cyclase MoaA [Syntrophomonadaceae bacterium]
MLDCFGRDINYLRISITDRCNLRCLYCMPEEGIDDKLTHSSILSLEDMARLVKISTSVGVRKVRLTGGEPLVRRNIAKLIDDISSLGLIDDIAITTNGVLFSDLAPELKKAGLNRVNFSLDSLQAEKFNYITRLGQVDKVIRSINTALEMDFQPVKINTVVIRGFNDDEILSLAKLAYDYPLHIRFIEFMPIGNLLYWKKNRLMKCEEVEDIIAKEYQLIDPNYIPGNGPAKYFNLQGGQGSVGFISPMSNHFCHECNRIRMTADGKLRGCLYDKKEIDLRFALENGASDEELRKLFIKAINDKPSRHHMNSGWGNNNARKMYQIGG